MESFGVDDSLVSNSVSKREDGSVGSINKNKKNWTNQLEYILAVLGCIVGFGNLWRFPYICQRNGGGVFLIPFLFALVTCGLPVFFLEIALGQFSAKSTIHVWCICPLMKGIGIGQFILTGISTIHYQHIIVWSAYYMVMSCSSVLPWSTCNNAWNTPSCVEHWNTSKELADVTSETNTSSRNNFTFRHTAVDEFWQYKTLGRSEGIDEMGNVQWHLAVSLLSVWIVVFLCLIKGVTSVGKVVYVTALLPYVLLLVLLVRTAILPGAVDGIVAYVKPDLPKLLDMQVWMEAMLQMFYSLGAGWGTVVALASYNKFNYNCLRNTFALTFGGEGTSLLAGFVVFTVLGFMAKQSGSDATSLSTSGPGLGFVVYTEGLSQLPVPQLWSVLFFLMMILVGIDCLFAWTETVITVICDQFPNRLMSRRIWVTASVCTVYFLAGLIFTTKAGIFYFQLLDWYLSILGVLSFSVLECVTVMWIYGAKRFNDDVELMIGRRVPLPINFLLAYVTPVLLTIVFVVVLWQFRPPSYGEYVFPYHWQTIGWIFASLSVIPLPIMVVVTLYGKQGSFVQRLKSACEPDGSWMPANSEVRGAYRRRYASYERTTDCLRPCNL